MVFFPVSFLEVYEVTQKCSDKISTSRNSSDSAAKFQAQPPSFPPDLQSHKGEEFDHFPVANMQPQGVRCVSQDSPPPKESTV